MRELPPRYPRRTFQAERAAGRKAGIRQTQQERDGAMDVQMSSGWVGPQRGQAPFSPCPKLKTVEICDHQHIKSHLFLFLEGLAEVGRGMFFSLRSCRSCGFDPQKSFPGLENLEKSNLLHVYPAIPVCPQFMSNFCPLVKMSQYHFNMLYWGSWTTLVAT